jgi:hypothetical protein
MLQETWNDLPRIIKKQNAWYQNHKYSSDTLTAPVCVKDF